MKDSQFSSKFGILPNLKGVCLKIPKSIFPGESVDHAIVRLHLQGNTQAAIKQKIHCGSSGIINAIIYFEAHNVIQPEIQGGRPSKLTNSVLTTYVQMKSLQNRRFASHKIREFEH